MQGNAPINPFYLFQNFTIMVHTYIHTYHSNCRFLHNLRKWASHCAGKQLTNPIKILPIKTSQFIYIALAIGTIFTSCDTPIVIETDKEQTDTKKSTLRSQTEYSLLDLLGNACIPENFGIPDCNDSLFVDTVVINNLPNYPHCKFTVIFHTYICDLGNLLDVTVGDFQILHHDCLSFSNDLQNPNIQSIYSTFIADFDLSVWEVLEEYIIDKYFDDPNIFNCGSGMFWNINFVRSACYRMPTFMQGEGIEVIYKVSCGSQCCEKHTRVCRNQDGTLNLTTYDATNPWFITCDGPDILMNSEYWLNNVVTMDPCRVRCPN
ncbi:MAG: hypothetical protein EA409_13830 [Saprospirales bacterium]|nr:MAG: hypothetical protein EA409_13830 [Saprospirales bacterium]